MMKPLSFRSLTLALLAPVVVASLFIAGCDEGVSR